MRIPSRPAGGLSVYGSPQTIVGMSMLTTRLFVVRHAVAEDAPSGGDDRARRLTGKGRRRFARLVRRLVRAGLEIDLVATSPLVRARETAEILAEALPSRPRIEVIEALAPGADWHALVEWMVHQGAGSVAWVGHAPCVGRLVAMSIGDGTAAVRMEKGSIAAIALDDGPGHPGDLEWLVHPDLLRRR